MHMKPSCLPFTVNPKRNPTVAYAIGQSMNSKPRHVLEVFLNPGEYYFGDRKTRMRTILGSCVSMTFWHPRQLMGGMSHIMLPVRPTNRIQPDVPANAMYADEAMELLIKEMKHAGTLPNHYQVKLFGGGDMFPNYKKSKAIEIGLKNIAAVRAQLDKHGFHSHAEHVGGSGHRYIIFDVWNGNVWVRHHRLPKMDSQNAD